MRIPLLSVVVLLRLAAAPALLAQAAPRGGIEGQVADSLHARPLAGAMVIVIPRAAGDSQFRSVITDDRGRFSLDSLPPGRYQVEVSHSLLDSLEFNLPPREVVVTAGERAHIDFGIPTSATLRAGACPGVALDKGRGAVVGQVTDAETEKPLVGAQVAVTWTDLTLDRATMQPSVQQRGGAVTVDSLGFYRLCGVPTDSHLLVQVQHKGRVGSALRMIVPEDVGVMLRNLSLSASAARDVAELDSLAATGSEAAAPRRLSGTAGLAGTVRAAGGQPLSGAQVRVVDATGTAMTDSLGSFGLTNLPAGTQILEVRRIGYVLGQIPVELRGGRTVSQSVTLSRFVSLDSIKVVARRSQYREYEARARRSGFGRFLSQEDLEKRHLNEMSDVVRTMSGFRVEGAGFAAKVVSSRGPSSFRQASCETNIVIDGLQHQDINLVDPQDVGALEAYSSSVSAPMQYQSGCGVIVIWTKR
jgi:hypothetical protein